MEAKRAAGVPNFPVVGFPQIGPGFEALYSACLRLYNDQPNPLQVVAVLKYWLGGPDPLDCISMYENTGDENEGIPPHWHYVSYGLSDLYGDGRVHEVSNGATDGPSGFGFELTFRLCKERGETAPPTWPAAVMQGLAKYVFQSGNVLCDGDHVSWHCPLDNSESRIEHMLMTEDPQLETVTTPFGKVTYIQIVGVCAEELKAAQQWNGRGFVQLMQRVKGAGGPWLVTDMRRGETVFELEPGIAEAVDRGIETEGSDLSGVSARLCWSEDFPCGQEMGDVKRGMGDRIEILAEDGTCGSPPHGPSKQMSDMFGGLNKSGSGRELREVSRKASFDSDGSDPAETRELMQTRLLDAVHLQLNLEAGLLFPLVLRGRLKHGRHFTFKSSVDCAAVTFVVPSVIGAFASSEHPYAVQGSWLQVLLTEDFLAEMTADMESLSCAEGLTLPKTYSWPDRKMSITLVPEEL
ncbi:suppressor of fused homolog [Ornithodoros turicata]